MAVLKKYEGNEEEVVIDQDIAVIGDYAFYGCTNMKRIHLPDGLKEIGSDAFYGCENLEEVIIPDSVYYIGEGLFARCRSLKKAVLSASLTSVPKITFFQCESLVSVTLPQRIRRIGRAAFEQCRSLEKLELPSALRIIEDNAFDDCTSLRDIVLPDHLESLGSNVFFNCTAMRLLVLPDTLTSVGKGALETRSKLSLSAPHLAVRPAMLDNNWNLNWNFGANGRYNGRNEDNYQLFRSYLPHVTLKEWKPLARVVLAANYLETFESPIDFYDDWIKANTDELLAFLIQKKRYDALLAGVDHDLLDTAGIEPYFEAIKEPAVRARLMEKRRNASGSLDDLFDMLA